MVTKGLTHHGSNGQVGDIVVVHDVKVDYVSTGLKDIVNLFTKPGKVSRKNRRSDEVVLVSPDVQRRGGTSRLLLSREDPSKRQVHMRDGYQRNTARSLDDVTSKHNLRGQ